MTSRPGIADRPARILIVDDERQNRQVLEVMLAPDHYDIVTAATGEDALAIVAQEPPDLILLDIMMPGMDGYQVAVSVKRNPATKNIPIIMVTALDDRDARLRGLVAGAEDFLSKPVDRAELSVRVKNLLRLKAYGDHYDRYSQELEHEVAARTAELVESERASAAALRQERDRAQRYLDTAAVILLALDRDGRITLVNQHACSVLGWTGEALRGRDWFETCIPARVRDHVRTSVQNLLDGDLSVVENLVLTGTGEERLIEWRNTVLRDDEARVVGTFSSGTDVTDRHRATETLRTTEERMRFALEAACVGIWDMDFASGTLQCSAILEAQYGLRPGTFGGTLDALMAHVHPDDRQALSDTMSKAESGADFSTEYRALWADGTVRWLSGAGRIHTGDDGRAVRGVGISLDITDRRVLEQQYQQAQKMEAIGRLAGGVAHDFNNLLTAILGYCELLLADLAPGDPRQLDISEIQKAGTAAAALTRQLLAFSRKEIIQPTLLDLNVVVADMRTMLGRLIREDVKVLLGLRPGLGSINADRGQVEQIVLNLAVNARDAMPKGGTLTIETAQVDLDEHYAGAHFPMRPGPYVTLTVTDTGAGMTPETQARMFEPFFTTKEMGKGTGLGLAMVHGIVARSGGSVNVYSEVGKGTSFKVYFPKAHAETAVMDAPVATPLRGGSETILVAEDAEGLRHLTQKLLERHGYTVLLAANAGEALQLFRQHPSIDLLLTDVVMPGPSGPDLSGWLVAERPTLKVIYMSGYTEDAIVEHGVLNAGIAFLNKPFNSDTLGRKIREVLDRQDSGA